MRRARGPSVRALVLGVLLISGCDRSNLRQPYPPDPMLASRKPVEGKGEKAAVVQVACTEPAAPAPPSTALASAPVNLSADGTPRLAAQLLGISGVPPPAVTAAPAARSSGNPGVPAIPASRRQEAEPRLGVSSPK